MKNGIGIKVEQILEARGAKAAFAIALSASLEKEEVTIRDMVRRLSKYGTLSEPTWNYLTLLLERIGTRAERAAKYAAEKAAAGDCPSGRVTIKGEILKSEQRESAFGPVWKMLVKSDAGYLVWSSVPSKCTNAARGAKVQFVATVKPSPDDPKFGFATRPMMAGKVLPA